MISIRPWQRQAIPAALWSLVACAPTTTARAEPPALAYRIQAALDPEAHEVHGEAIIHLHNRLAPTDELWLQLYANAPRDAHSLYQAGRPPPDEDVGWIVISSLQVDGRERLQAAETELLPGDHSRLRLPLPSTLATGESLELRVRFVTRLPRLGTRAGHHEDFHIVSQWYPRLAYRSPDGRWQAHPFHRMAEFRANFASYALQLEVPEGFRVEASGERVDSGGGGVHFRAAPVTDVAWVACRSCVATREVHGAVTVRGLHARGAPEAAARQREVVARGLRYLGETLAPYPHDSLAVITPPRTATAAGMEYPGLIVTPAGPGPLRSSPFIDGRHVAAHELAHQWFYGLVSSDEVRWPVLDEGLTQWATCDLLETLWPRRALGAPTSLGCFEALRASVLWAAAPPPPAGNPAYAYSRRGYGQAVYARAALALESVRRSHGDRRFRRALKHYVREAAFAHGSVELLARAFDRSYHAGFFARTVAPLLLEGAACDVHLDAVQLNGRAPDGQYRTRVRAYRSGHASLPTWVALFDARDALLTRTPWPARAPTLELTADTESPVARVEIDPQHALLVDTDHLDQRVGAAPGAPKGSWTTWLFALGQALLSWWGP